MRLRPTRVASFFALVPVIVLTACGSDSSVTPGPVAAPVWSEITNLVPSVTLYGMWAPRADYIIGVGSGGQIWQWDGQQWSQRVNGYPDDLHAIDGDTQGKVVAVGNNGTVLEQVNGSFVRRDASVTDDLHGVWRSPSGQFVAVGDYGAILRGDGTTWSQDSTLTHEPLLSVWGSGDSDVFAAGVDGIILHHDGAAWSSMVSPTTQFLTSVSGTSDSDVYAVGAAGTILHYNGSAWSPVESHTADLLQSVCAGCGPAAAGANGSVVRMESGVFNHEKMTGAPWLYAMARAGEDTWAIGAHALFRDDGVAWTPEARGTIPVLRGMTSTPSTGLVVVGDDGATMLGGLSRWSFEDAGALQRLNAVWTSPSGEIFAAGTNRIFRYTNDGWVVENSDIVEYFDIGGNSEHIFAVGKNGAIRERHGTTWSGVNSDAIYDLHAIHMTDTEGYIAGIYGIILYFDGAGWTVKYTRATGGNLWDITPVQTAQYRAIAVGAGGLSLGRSTAEAVGWITMETPVSTTLYSLARGPGGYLFAVGAGGTVLRLLDEKWIQVNVPTTRTFFKAWERDGALFACGGGAPSGGILFRYGPPNQ